MRRPRALWCAGAISSVLVLSAIDAGERTLLEEPPYTRWETFDTDDGLPSNKVFCVRVDAGRVWAGTENGLACREGDTWKTWSTGDGLPHAAVLALDVSPRSGDLWIGTMGGLARLSGGRIDVFTQLSSGLSNDFVNAVVCDPDDDHVWAATAMGASRLHLRTGEWTIFTEQNTPMAEPWTYSAAIDRGLVYIGAWGAGVLEFQKRTGRWREYRDPDKEMEIDLLPDDGPVHDVTASIEFREGILWQATYFGLARYDGRTWRTYFESDSGLTSDFIQFVRSRGRVAWCCTDKGLCATDGDSWVAYHRRDDGRGLVMLFEGKEPVKTLVTDTAPAHDFALGVDFEDDAIWVATEAGVSRGERDRSANALAHVEAVLPDGAGRALDGRAPAATADGIAVTGADTDAEARTAPGDGRTRRFRYAKTPEALQPYRRLEVYREFFTAPPEFRGAGRNRPDPEVEDVRIGFIGSLEDEDGPTLSTDQRSGIRGGDAARLFGRPMLRAARLAIEQANADGGYHGVPFRLVIRTDLVQWGQTSNELARFAYDDGVWAVLSGVESNHQHVLARATLKAEVPVVNAGSSDPTLLEHAIPWLIRVHGDDRQNAYTLLDYVFRVRRLSRLAVLRSNDRDGRVGIAELIQGARRLGRPVVVEQRFENGETDFSQQLGHIAGAGADALFLLGNPRELGLIVKAVRAEGLSLPLFAFDRAVHPAFLEAAGAAAEGVVATASFNPDLGRPAWVGFLRAYRERYGEEPGAFAAHAFDGMNLIIRALRTAGLNRARIRDALFAMKPIDGVTGTIELDSTGNNVRAPWLAEVRDGAFRYFRPPPADREGDTETVGSRTGGGSPAVLGVYAAAADARTATAEEIRRGAEAAVAGRANGGGLAVRLVVASAPDPWMAGGGELVRLVYGEGASAVLGPVDGPAAHVAAQVVARARGGVVMLTPWASDPRLTRAGVPWLFRLAHDDRLQAEALAGEIVAVRGLRRVLLVVDPDDPDSACAAEAFERAAGRHSDATLRRAVPRTGRSVEDCALDRSIAFDAEAVALFLPPEPAARVARHLRSSGVSARFFGPLGLASATFLEAAGAAAEGTILAAPARPEGPRADRFRARYRELRGREPGIAALYGHDGAVLLAAALEDASRRGPVGCPRERLRRALVGSSREGLTGRIDFDDKGNRIGPAPLSRVERGALRPLQRGQRGSDRRSPDSAPSDDS